MPTRIPSRRGVRRRRSRPRSAGYRMEMREWVLPYEAMRAAADPDAMLLEFLQSTYGAAADLGGWDRKALER